MEKIMNHHQGNLKMDEIITFADLGCLNSFIIFVKSESIIFFLRTFYWGLPLFKYQQKWLKCQGRCH